MFGRLMESKMWREDKIGRMLSNFSPVRKIIDEIIWTVRLPVEQTLFRYFEKYKAIDVPLFNHDYEGHKNERYLLGAYYNDIHDKKALDDFESAVLENYLRNKEELLNSIDRDYDIVWFFTSLLDLWGHVHIAKPAKMMKVYKEVNDLVGEVKNHGVFTIIVSDHGMVQVSKHFGDHRDEGFWSSNEPLRLKKPTLGQLHQVLVKQANRV
jgi:hypothetical protein